MSVDGRLLSRAIILTIFLLTLLGCSSSLPPKIVPSANSISGHVYRSDGKTPIAQVKLVFIYLGGNLRGEVTTTSSSDGAYIIGNLIPGKYKVQAWAKGYRPEGYDGVDGVSSEDFTPITLTPGAIITGIDFKMKLLCSISGRVYDASTRAPIVNAKVYAQGWHWIVDGCPGTQTAGDGTYKITELNAVESVLKAVADEYVPAYYKNVYSVAEATKVVTRFGENTPGIDIALEKGGSISGHVYQADGITPAAKVNVTWKQQGKSSVITPDPRVGGPLGPISVQTSTDGSYIIKGLLSGTYELTAQVPGKSIYSSSRTVTVIQRQHTQGVDLKLPQ